MRRASTDWRAADAEIVDGRYVRQQGANRPAEETIEQIAWLMERSIPIGGYRIGLDPILGLIPGVGDVLSSLISTVLVVQAYRAGVPKITVMRMVGNVGIDAVLGAVPFIGDLFDFVWKANTKNLELFRASVTGQRRTSSDWGFVLILALGLALVLAIPVLLLIWMARAIF